MKINFYKNWIHITLKSLIDKEEAKNLIYQLKDYVGKFEVIKVANITNICYGRDVGYKIEEIILPKQIQEISATKIRQEMKNEF